MELFLYKKTQTSLNIERIHMKRNILGLIGLATLLATAACHRPAPVAKTPPPDTTPVPAAPAPPQPGQRASTPAPPPAQRAAAPTPSQPKAMPAAVRASLNERLARLEDALFDYDKATIRTDASVALKGDVDVIRGILSDFPSQKLLIEGNADERGSEEYNLALGDKRARAAEEFLTSMGISSAQLTIVSFGKDRPVCTDKTEDCWQKNRRAHLTAAP
jgi:peptidoglycan-associated lipoprotein